MTEQDLEIQELRRELERLKHVCDSLRRMHHADLAEITYLRRVLEAAIEGREE